MRGWAYLSKGIAAARAARRQTGKPILRQLAEIVELRRWRLTPGDYYAFRLFDDARLTPAQKREYTGSRFLREAYPFINDPGLIARSGLAGGWDGAVDKLLFDCVMRGAGVATPPVLAVYDTAGIEYGGIETCRTPAQLTDFLRSRARTPFFVKPARAHTGVGAMAIERLGSEAAALGDGSSLGLDELVQRIDSYGRALLQERLSPHAVLLAAAGPSLATIRAVVLRRPAGSTLHRTVLRLPTGANVVDNFDAGHSGNLVGWVDPATGEVLRVYAGLGVSQVRVERHPDTGASLDGLRLPDWPEALALVERASRLLSAMPLQSWDLALTDRGPVMVEVNDVSSQDVLQLAGPPGMLDHELCAFLREQGFRWPDPHR